MDSYRDFYPLLYPQTFHDRVMVIYLKCLKKSPLPPLEKGDYTNGWISRYVNSRQLPYIVGSADLLQFSRNIVHINWIVNKSPLIRGKGDLPT